MKTGIIWQKAIGNYPQFEDLKNGDSCGLDVISRERKIIMEIKNRYNTDNTSSRKTKYMKLANFKKSHTDYECIYAVINDTTKEGIRQVYQYDGWKLSIVLVSIY
jgi:hypothetical protein